MPRSSFQKSLTIVMSGTVLGQVIIAASSPLLTRIYEPQAFGILAIFSAIVTIFYAVFTMRIEMAILAETDDEVAADIIAAALTLCVGLTLVMTLVAIALIGPVQSITGEIALASLLWALPVGCAGLAAFTALTQWSLRVSDFPTIARRNVVRAVGTVTSQVGLGMAGYSVGGAAIGLSAGHVLGAASMGASLKRPPKLLLSPVRCLKVLRQRASFALSVTLATVLNSSGSQLPVLIIAATYPVTDVGQLGLTQRVLAIPVALIGTSVSQVYLGHYSTLVRAGNAGSNSFRRISAVLLVLGLGGAIVLITFGPPLFSFVFGDEWTVAGHMAGMLAIGACAQLAAAPAAQLMVVAGQPNVQLSWDAGRLVAVTGVVVACALMDWPILAITLAWGIAVAVTFGAHWLLCDRVIRRKDLTMRTNT